MKAHMQWMALKSAQAAAQGMTRRRADVEKWMAEAYGPPFRRTSNAGPLP
jgi:hypothetical protein